VPEPELAPERLLGVLREHGVRFVVIGGFAAVVHGSPHVTFDIDVVPERADENLERLSDALSAMHARVWTSSEPDGVPFSHDAHSLADVNVWNLVTDHGRLDLTFVPSGTRGFEDLERDAVRLTILPETMSLRTLTSRADSRRPRSQRTIPSRATSPQSPATVSSGSGR